MSEGSLSDPWSYTEQLLHTLDEFETPDGFRIKHLDSQDPNHVVLGCWRISLGPFKSDEPKSRFNLWLVMLAAGGWVLSETPSITTRHSELRSPLYTSPEELLTVAKERLRAREAAVRLGAR